MHKSANGAYRGNFKFLSARVNIIYYLIYRIIRRHPEYAMFINACSTRIKSLAFHLAWGNWQTIAFKREEPPGKLWWEYTAVWMVFLNIHSFRKDKSYFLSLSMWLSRSRLRADLVPTSSVVERPLLLCQHQNTPARALTVRRKSHSQVLKPVFILYECIWNCYDTYSDY